jgi:hypothetical protein
MIHAPSGYLRSSRMENIQELLAQKAALEKRIAEAQRTAMA